MLPKIDLHGGRGPQRRDLGHARDGEPSAVVPLPRLRLLKQVAGEEQAVSAAAPLPPQRKPPSAVGAARGLHAGPRADSEEVRPGSNQQPQKRGRGLLRPLDPSGEVRLPGRSRSPPVQPRSLHSRYDSRAGAEEEEEDTEESTALLLQQRARERIKQERRQRRRAAKEEEERKLQEEQERLDRAQKNAGQVEAHRRELARQAAERSRRLREDREAAMQEREELQSARRERMSRYMTPDKIREWRQKDGGNEHEDGGSSNEAVADQPPLLCDCGNQFMPDAVFCRKCGAKRPGGKRVRPVNGSGRPSPEPGAVRRAARAPSTEPPSRRARRRRSEGDSGAHHRRGHNLRQHDDESSQQQGRGRRPKGTEGATQREDAAPSPEEAPSPANAAKPADRLSAQVQAASGHAAPSASRDYYRQHVLQAMSPATWAALYTPFMVQHAGHFRTATVSATDTPAAEGAAKVTSLPTPGKAPLETPCLLSQDRLRAALVEAWASGALARAVSDGSSPASMVNT
mmetsp:Transcript_17571/g.29304  ORF Transcript_17571/g.29304 Transcript_17571/m.29304 type:complete len:515 (-) Transcript_17571:63-1607(-)